MTTTSPACACVAARRRSIPAAGPGQPGSLEDLEALDFEEWEDLELPETHYEWAVPTSEAPDDRARRLADAARELWAIAVHWTRAKGPVCDFQLRGYGGDDEILFEDGKRCNLSSEQSRYDDTERERAPVDEAMRAMIIDERAAWLQMDRVSTTARSCSPTWTA